tara:strand:+ start:7099 stop:8601 length:1503 start_codon:yes stop_codon:yes gene_type:complete
MKIKNSLLKVKKILSYPWYCLKKIFTVLTLIYHYIFRGSTVFIGKIFSRKKNDTRSQKIKRILYIIFIIIPLVVLSIWVLVRQNAFFVPVGGGAVVTRFGAYDRSVSTGIHLKIPVVERYYIVYKGFIKQQTFGFIQVKPTSTNSHLTDAEIRADHVKESEISSAEQDDEIFPKKGGLLASLAQKQRVTSEYNREMMGLERPLTLEQALAIRNRNSRINQESEMQGLSENGRLDDPNEGLIITHDLNIINMRWAIQYNIHNMKDYLFNAVDADKNLHDLSLAIMNQLVAKYDFFEILTSERSELEKQASNQLQAELDKLKLGLRVTNFIIVDALPPQQVQFAFDEVNRATQRVQTLIYNAQRDFNKSVYASKGRAQQIVQEAYGQSIMIKQLAMGDIGQFNQILSVYQSWPDLVKDRLYIDTMNTLFKDQNITLIDSQIDGVMPIFPLNNLMNSNSPHDATQKLVQDALSSQANINTNTQSSASSTSSTQSSTSSTQSNI